MSGEFTPDGSVYSAGRYVDDLRDCYFYHTVELPEYGPQIGEWDLRNTADAYLGHFPFSGKRVLEIGTASGFLCFHMEREGAEVIAYDLSEEQSWDIVPFSETEPDYEAAVTARRKHIQRINNAWWLTHRLFGSQARVVYGTAYEIPESIGKVDVVTFGSVLLHLRDPLKALCRGARLAREALIITETSLGSEDLDSSPIARFLPNAKARSPIDSWWCLSPIVVCEFARIAGFPAATITYHHQTGRVGRQVMYTIVARRS
jgi:SAM-dependent methyltransferase